MWTWLRKPEPDIAVRFEWARAYGVVPEIVSAMAPDGVDADALVGVLQRADAAGLAGVTAGYYLDGGVVPNSWWAESRSVDGDCRGVSDCSSLLAALLMLVSLTRVMVGNGPRWVACRPEQRPPMSDRRKGRSALTPVDDGAAAAINGTQTFVIQPAHGDLRVESGWWYYVKPGGRLVRLHELAGSAPVQLVGFRRDPAAGDVEIDLEGFYRSPQRVVRMFAVVEDAWGGRSGIPEPIGSVRPVSKSDRNGYLPSQLEVQ